ncbi:MAG TPA: TetR/AcrR family transcriptional regulator, partial [Nitrospirae bacterium]|nr:TetR/AcrR family transcriptional regulator [Nitrospirota bacterium]
MKKTAKKFDRKTRRAQIVQAALRIIGSRGVGALTTAAIAKEVGISEANLYRHFENKEEILNAMTE